MANFNRPRREPSRQNTQQSLENFALELKPNLIIENNEKATITIRNKWFRIFKMKDGGIRYQTSLNHKIKNLDFYGIDDLAKKLSRPFTDTFGLNRPNFRKQVEKIYMELSLVCTPYSPKMETKNTVFYNIKDHENATLTLGGHVITIQKLEKGIRHSIDGGTPKILYFNNVKDLNLKIGKWLDHEIGTRRLHAPTQMRAIYRKLNLTECSGRKESAEYKEAIQKTEKKTLLGIDYGTYQLEKNKLPETYLLVRNNNSGCYYCLSLVQEMFDLIYGKDSAKRAGLYSSNLAENLQVYDLKNVKNERYNPVKHTNLKKGTILRFSKELSITHIGISLGENKIAHIIGDILYIDKLSNISEGWSPKEILIPNNSFRQKPLEIKTYKKVFKKNRSIESISPFLKKNIPKLKHYNSAAIEEIIYQLNKDKFKMILSDNYNQDTLIVLKADTKLNLPKEWILT